MFLIHFIIKIVESIYFVHFSFNNFNNHHTGKAKVSESVFFHSRTPLTLDIIKIIGYKSQGSRYEEGLTKDLVFKGILS